jgi:WD40 repeat protein
MVMALSLFHVDEVLTLVAGYENGMAVVAQLDPKGTWVTRYQAQTHSQPILSLDVSPKLDFFITSGADAIIAKHPIPTTSMSQPTPSPPTTTNPSNADPVGTTPSSPPSAHHPASPSQPNPSKSLLAAALANAAPALPSSSPSPTLVPEKPILESTPIKKVNTKHAGQQSLRIRSDGAIFATAGWDARVRVYSTKTLAEVAVCKWHEAGCYAVAFADVLASSTEESSPPASGAKGQLEGCGTGEDGSRTRDIVPVVPKLVAVTVSERRMRQARRTHWLAAGSKDGKVSLWDVF